MLSIFKKEASFWGIFYRSIGRNPLKFFLNWYLILNIILEFTNSIIIYNLFQQLAKIIETRNINIFVIGSIFVFQIYNKIIDLVLFNPSNAKKVEVVNLVQNYLKQRFLEGNNKFHDSYDISEKFNALISNMWNYDTIHKTVSDLISSCIRTITILIQLSYSDYKIGLIIIFGHIVLFTVIPKISKYIENKNKDIKTRELYARSYTDVVIFEENRTNPSYNSIQKENMNKSLGNIVLGYATKSYFYTIENLLNELCNITVILLIIALLKYNDSIDGIILILFNRSYIFGFVNEYNSMIEIEKNSEKHMKELFEMLQTIQSSEKELNMITTENYNVNLNMNDEIIINNLNYEIINQDKKLTKKIISDNLKIQIKKGIVLLNGRTGAGKSLTTKILGGFYDGKICDITLNHDKISNFSQFNNSRVIISQKIAEDYAYNGSIKMTLEQLYPSGTYDEILKFLANFDLENKIPENLQDKFNDKLSGGERQRVALSSCIWKTFKNPIAKMMIIDEPEKGIDETTCIKIMNFIISNFDGLLFLITHNEKIKEIYEKNIVQKWNFVEEDDGVITKIIPSYT